MTILTAAPPTEEITKLRKQVRELTMERDIPEEAADIFAKHWR